MSSYHFRFQDVVGRGSPRRYWHYLWGYLLPSVGFLAEKGLLPGRAGTLVFDSYGPVMDRVLDEYMSLLSLDYRLADSHRETATSSVSEQRVPRWDLLQRSMAWVYLRPLPVSPGLTRRERWSTAVSLLRQEKLWTVRSILGRQNLLRHLDRIKRIITNALPNQPVPKLSKQPFLILDRSPPPAEYAGQTDRTSREYGTATRSLRGVDETIDRLTRLGYRAERFEPGNASQIVQINRYRQARGVIAIRGAELANMHWLTEGSRLIILRTQSKFSTHLYGMAQLLELDFHELACEVQRPDLSSFAMERYLGDP